MRQSSNSWDIPLLKRRLQASIWIFFFFNPNLLQENSLRISYWKLNEHTYRCEIPSQLAASFIFFFHISNRSLLEKLLPFSSIVSFYSLSSIRQIGFPARLLLPLPLMALPHTPPMLPCKPLSKLCIHRHQKTKRVSPEKPCSYCTKAAWNSGHFNKGNIVIEAAQPSEVPGNFETRNLWGKDKWNLLAR